jgi:hypothetical protein
VCAAVTALSVLGGAALRAADAGDRQAAVPSGDTLVYADFENPSPDGKPVSSRGGAVNLWGYQEQPTRQSVFKGPNRVRTSKENENHAAQFEYELLIPNEWAGVTMEIQGQPGPVGNLPQDDVSGFKHISVQAYVKNTINPAYMRVEVMSNGERINLHSGYPMTTFKLKDGFNTYKVPLKAFAQPGWVQDSRVDPKQILKTLTSITFSVYCEQTCRPDKGMVIIDNVVFEK